MKEEYYTTHFKTPLTAVEIPETFYIITAWNPFGEQATDTENEKANATLLQHLSNSGWHHFPVTGYCEDHHEDGFGTVCEKAAAISLGKECSQDAIYEVKADKVILVDCKADAPDETIGLWSELLT